MTTSFSVEGPQMASLKLDFHEHSVPHHFECIASKPVDNAPMRIGPLWSQNLILQHPSFPFGAFGQKTEIRFWKRSIPHFPFGAFGHKTEIQFWEEERPSFSIWGIRSEN
ncbi:hypothetical protein AVEN_113229-1 [Araneus ventricosus]|uniref:Uncharacterized protein n=1 Tax=Araneus ventricosus TaxID=182803 RepID=A0A4Y2P3M6_ARAVE|nr:hypothetical protein AVEN_113229-1 [Araneus ventricosus]